MRNKKAELTATRIITLILLVISFVVLIGFFGYALFSEWESRTDREICHESIIFRATLPGIGDVKETVPLKCKTEKICLTMSGDDCEEFGVSKIKPVTKVRLSSDIARAKDKIKETVATALFDCHSMLGEGKLNFKSPEVGESNYCLICSRLVLDKEAKEKIDEIGYMELYRYMRSKKTPGGISYLEATYDVANISDMRDLLENARGIINQNPELNYDHIEDMKFNLSMQQTIIAQLAPEGTWDNWLYAGGLGTAVAVTVGIVAIPFTGGISIVGVGAAIFAGGVAGGSTVGVLYFKNFPEGGKYGYPAILPYSFESLKTLNCTQFETAP